MSDAENRFEVEKFLARKLNGDNDDFHYLLKWKGHRDRTWEPRAHLDQCEELLHDFELKQARRAINVRINDRRIEYLIEQKDGMPAVVVPSVQAFENWPGLIFTYLEKNIHFAKATNNDGNSVTEFDGVLGQPINIAYVSNVDRDLKYWCEWPLNRGKFVDSNECIKKWPRMVQTFLESKLGEVNDGSNAIGARVLTRNQRRMAAQFERIYGVRVERNINYDKVLILKPSEKVTRRRTVGVPQVTPKSCLKQRRSLAPARAVTFDAGTHFNDSSTLNTNASVPNQPIASGSQITVANSATNDGSVGASLPIQSAASILQHAVANKSPIPITNAASASNSATNDGSVSASVPIQSTASTLPQAVANKLPIPADSSENRAQGGVESQPKATGAPNASSASVASILQRRTYSPTPAPKPQDNVFVSKVMLQKPN